jgi:hypothetical protein
MSYYESPVFTSTSFCPGVAVAATVAARSQHWCWAIQAMQSDMAVGGRIQHRRSQRHRGLALHQCSQMGEAVSFEGPGGSARSSSLGSAKDLLGNSGDARDPNGDLSSARLAVGVHHLVLDKAGKPSAPVSGTGIHQSGNDSPYSLSPGSSIPHRTNMVRKQRPPIRGKKNAIIGLYRNPPKRGQVVCFDEMGPLQTIPRGGRAWGKRARRRSNRYKRNGTLQWLCAFCPMTGQAIGKGFPSRSGDSCRQFWENHMFSFWPKGSVYLVTDNLSAHKKALRELPAKFRRRLHVSWTPTNSSWLNLIESYFATLNRTALYNTDYKSPDEIEQGLQNGVGYLNDNPRPYKWKKV